MVLAIEAPMAIPVTDNMRSGDIRIVRDKPERKVEFEIFMVQQEVRLGLRTNSLHDKTEWEGLDSQRGSQVLDSTEKL